MNPNMPKPHNNAILGYLDKHHGISTETIYNDLHGFIRNQDMHQIASIAFYVGQSSNTQETRRMQTQAKLEHYDKAIEHYSTAIAMQPNFVIAYNNRGIAYADKGEHDLAIADFNMAIKLKPDYADCLQQSWDCLPHHGRV